MQPLWSAAERVVVENKLAAAIVGSDWTVKAGLEKLVRQTGADEVIVVTDTYEPADRLESYRRVAEIAAGMGIQASSHRDQPEEAKTMKLVSPAVKKD
jgi:alkanesulfonate monooxygenase SsuD/methylene tetrahydromethanopterin reductase-like flavin-dependent oxidoreductase (luciferase family)